GPWHNETGNGGRHFTQIGAKRARTGGGRAGSGICGRPGPEKRQDRHPGPGAPASRSRRDRGRPDYGAGDKPADCAAGAWGSGDRPGRASRHPGFIEGHGHFLGLGQSKMNLNLSGVRSWDEIVAMVAAAAREAKPGAWILGRGWHQEKWDKPPQPNV